MVFCGATTMALASGQRRFSLPCWRAANEIETVLSRISNCSSTVLLQAAGFGCGHAARLTVSGRSGSSCR